MTKNTTVRQRSTGDIAIIREVNTESLTPYRVEFSDGRIGLLKASEIEIVDAHALDWHCSCASCVTARKTLGRSFAGPLFA